MKDIQIILNTESILYVSNIWAALHKYFHIVT